MIRGRMLARPKSASLLRAGDAGWLSDVPSSICSRVRLGGLEEGKEEVEDTNKIMQY